MMGSMSKLINVLVINCSLRIELSICVSAESPRLGNSVVAKAQKFEDSKIGGTIMAKKLHVVQGVTRLTEN